MSTFPGLQLNLTFKEALDDFSFTNQAICKLQGCANPSHLFYYIMASHKVKLLFMGALARELNRSQVKCRGRTYNYDCTQPLWFFNKPQLAKLWLNTCELKNHFSLPLLLILDPKNGSLCLFCSWRKKIPERWIWYRSLCYNPDCLTTANCNSFL